MSGRVCLVGSGSVFGKIFTVNKKVISVNKCVLALLPVGIFNTECEGARRDSRRSDVRCTLAQLKWQR